jgi:hypothetical protein
MAGLYETHNKKPSYGYAQIVFVWVFGIFYSIGFSGLLVAYTLEVLPYHLRAKGVMIMNITVQAILALSAQTNPIAIHKLPHGWNFWMFYTVSSNLKNLHPLNDNYFLTCILFCRFGIVLKPSGSTSSSPRPRALLLRKLPRSLMARMPLRTSTWNRPRKRSRSTSMSVRFLMRMRSVFEVA